MHATIHVHFYCGSCRSLIDAHFPNMETAGSDILYYIMLMPPGSYFFIKTAQCQGRRQGGLPLPRNPPLASETNAYLCR